MKQILIVIGLLTSSFVYGQESHSNDFLNEIKKYDLSDLWTLKEIHFEFEGDTSVFDRPEPLGYIGNNFQRFYIHFVSIIQNRSNKLEYFVYGKTRVKNNICSFQGLIKVKHCETSDESYTNTKQGLVAGEYEFFEDASQEGTGSIKGKFYTYFYIDTSNKIRYDALDIVADGYDNNQFEGTWTSYNSNTSKKCNWGDYRIPDSQELDCGTGEFMVDDKYVKNGWTSFDLARSYNSTDSNVVEAKKAEEQKWWLEK